VPGVGGVLVVIASSLLDAAAGVVAGALVLLAVLASQRILARLRA